MTACLDAFALLCWLQDEPGAEIVDGLLEAGARDDSQRCALSVINLGEVFYRLGRTKGEGAAEELWEAAVRGSLPVEVANATRRRIREAAAFKAAYRIAYADGFAIQLALERRLPLVTGDPEIRPVEQAEDLEVLWLPATSG